MTQTDEHINGDIKKSLGKAQVQRMEPREVLLLSLTDTRLCVLYT